MILANNNNNENKGPSETQRRVLSFFTETLLCQDNKGIMVIEKLVNEADFQRNSKNQILNS